MGQCGEPPEEATSLTNGGYDTSAAASTMGIKGLSDRRKPDVGKMKERWDLYDVFEETDTEMSTACPSSEHLSERELSDSVSEEDEDFDNKPPPWETEEQQIEDEDKAIGSALKRLVEATKSNAAR